MREKIYFNAYAYCVLKQCLDIMQLQDKLKSNTIKFDKEKSTQ